MAHTYHVIEKTFRGGKLWAEGETFVVQPGKNDAGKEVAPEPLNSRALVPADKETADAYLKAFPKQIALKEKGGGHHTNRLIAARDAEKHKANADERAKLAAEKADEEAYERHKAKIEAKKSK